jgi:hypothetical protein
MHVNRYIFVYEEKEIGIIVPNMLGATTKNSLWWVGGVNTTANNASTQNVVARRVLQDGYTIQIFLLSGDLLCKYLFFRVYCNVQNGSCMKMFLQINV